MMHSDDERTSGDVPTAPSSFDEESQPRLAHEVIATYVADAARSVPGVADLHASAWKGLSSRVREIHSGGVIIHDNERDPVDVEIHARVLWDTVIPELAGEIERAVRERVTALLSIDLGTVTLYVDEMTGPTEVTAPRED